MESVEKSSRRNKENESCGYACSMGDRKYKIPGQQEHFAHLHAQNMCLGRTSGKGTKEGDDKKVKSYESRSPLPQSRT